MNSTCDTCAISGKEGNLLTTAHWIVSLSRDQGYLGRAYVTLREHKGALSELTDAEWKDYQDIVRLLENACRKGLGATLANWTCLMNNAYQQKPYLPHVHWHLRPRYESAVTIDDMTFTDPDFGHHYDRDQHQTVDDETFNVILNKIKINL